MMELNVSIERLCKAVKVCEDVDTLNEVFAEAHKELDGHFILNGELANMLEKSGGFQMLVLYVD